MHKYVVAYGHAEIIEQSYEELLRPLVKKYVSENQIEQRIKMDMDDPAAYLACYIRRKW
jgi:hypothetical protein